jgi:hypothetical protein
MHENSCDNPGNRNRNRNRKKRHKHRSETPQLFATEAL